MGEGYGTVGELKVMDEIKTLDELKNCWFMEWAERVFGGQDE